MAEARTIKRHSSLLDEKNYNDMAKVKNKTGLSINRQINEAVSRFYIPHITDEIVQMQKKTNTLRGLSNSRVVG
jgi:hypothetical protein